MNNKTKEIYVVSKGFYIWMFILSIIVVILLLHTFIEIKEYETVTEFFVMDEGVKEFYKVKYISCQEGVVISKHLGKTKVYGCMGLEGNKCTGDGKLCHVKYRVEVRKR